MKSSSASSANATFSVNRAASGMLELARGLLDQLDQETILGLVAEQMRTLVCARVLLIELAEQGQLLVAAGAGEPSPPALGGRVTLQHSFSGHALRTRRAQRLDENLNRSRFEEHEGERLGLCATAAMAIPLIFDGHAYGALLVLDRLRNGPQFTVEDQSLLESLCRSAAVKSLAGERSRQRLAVAEVERSHWARQLHDDTLQRLSALRVILSSARRSGQLQIITQAVTEAIEHLEEGITNVRALISDLRPATLDELGTQAALQTLAERSARHGIEVDVSIDLDYEQGRQPKRHAPELETAIYRIAQEALANAAQHGQAKRAVLELHEQQGVVELAIRDDGQGFDPSLTTDGFGLLDMRERVDLLGGELTIDSAPGRGTTISVSMPALRRDD